MKGRRRQARAGWLGRAAAIAGAGALWPAPGPALEEDARLWANLALSSPVRGPLGAHLLVQPRVRDDMEELERLVLRPSLSWKLRERLSASLGYDAHLIRRPKSSVEHRIWQELSLATPFRRLAVSHRARLEQRFLDGVGDTPVRLRYRARAAHPLPGLDLPLEAVLSNEVFVNLNSPSDAPRTGFGEDRLFAGLRHRLAEGLHLDVGYQLQYVERRGPDLANHTLVLGVSFAR